MTGHMQCYVCPVGVGGAQVCNATGSSDEPCVGRCWEGIWTAETVERARTLRATSHRLSVLRHMTRVETHTCRKLWMGAQVQF